MSIEQMARLEDIADKQWIHANTDLSSYTYESIFMAGAQAAWKMRDSEIEKLKAAIAKAEDK